MIRHRWQAVGYPLAAGVLAGGAVLLYLRGRGLDLSPDSVSYLAAADQVLAGHGPRDFQGGPLVLWPPFYPLLLAAAAPVVGGVLAAGVLVQTLAQALVAGLLVHWWRRLGVATPLLAAGAAILALNRVTLHAAGYLWSEPLYGLLALAAVAVVAVPEGPVNGRRAAAAGVLAGAAWATRYLGVAVVATVVTAILAAGWRGHRRRALLLAALAGAIAAAPMAAWMLQNLQAVGSTTGPRSPGPGFSVAMIWEAWRVLSRVFLSGVLSGPVVLVLVVIGLTRLPAVTPAARRASLAVGGLLLAHTAVLIASVSAVAMDGIGRRFMQPVVAPAVFLAVLLLDQQRRRPRLGTRIVAGLGVLLAVYPVITGVAMIRRGRPLGDGDRPAPTLAVPPELRDVPWYSNEPLRVYPWQRRPVSHPPSRERQPTVASQLAPERWGEALRAGGGEACFLWWGARDDGRLADLQAIPGVRWEEAAADSQLIIFRLRGR